MGLPYRPEIDGLRALAILPVVAFHGGLGLPGGFVGVDVFFVLSGYLIGSLLIEERVRTGRIDVMGFYGRRALRLLPALVVVVLACLPFAWLWMLPEELAAFGRSMFGALFAISNILFWQESGYFSTAAELKPLLHTWSLAIEWQFYALFPCVLAVSWRFGHGIVRALGITCLLASFALAVWSSTTMPSAAFYLLPTRIWELLVGVLLALWLSTRPHPQGAAADHAAFGGLFAIGATVLAYDASIPWPGWWALPPVMGTAAIVWAGPRTRVARLLSHRPLVAIGLVSYSAYLWHQPLFAFARLRLSSPAPEAMAALSVLTFGLAWLTWRWVERPWRDRDRANWPRIPRVAAIGGGVAAGIGAAVIGVSLHVTGGVASRLPAEVAALDVPYAAMDRSFGADRPTPPHGAGVAVMGDSHAERLVAPLSDGLPLANLTTISCPPIPGLDVRERVGCAAHSSAALAALDDAEVPLVLLHARWPLWSEGKRFDNGQGGQEGGAPPDYVAGRDDGAGLDELVRASVQHHLDEGRKVVVVAGVPEMGWHVPDRLRRAAMIGVDARADVPRAVTDARHASTDAAFAPFAKDPRVVLVDPRDSLCDDAWCYAARDGRPLYADDDHLSPLGAEIVARDVLRAIEALR